MNQTAALVDIVVRVLNIELCTSEMHKK